MDNQVGVALVGCGGVASGYRGVYAELPAADFRLVVDVDAALAERVAAELKVARWSTDWRDALAEDIDAVDLSTPNHLHAEPAVALLGAGKHVLIQKPLAPSVAEARRIVDAAKASDRVAAVYMSDLDDPGMWQLRDAIRSGRLGTVTGVRGRYAHRGGLSAPKTDAYWRGSVEKTGGGSFVQLSIHHVNLAAWLLDDALESVSAYADNRLCPNIAGDDTAACVARFARTGALGVFESSWSADGCCFQVYGSAGSATLHGVEGAALEIVCGDERIERPPVSQASLRRAANPFSQHAAFVRAVRGGPPPAASVADGLRDVAVCRAVYESARTGRRVTVEEVLA